MNEPIIVSKDNKTVKIQRKYIIIAIFFVVTLILASSYAYLTNYDSTNEVITITSGSLRMSITNTELTLADKLPESDENALQNTQPVQIVLTNIGDLPIEEYKVKLIGDTGSTLNDAYIRYSVSEDNITYKMPYNLNEQENIIFTGYDLGINNSKTLYIKIWLDENAGNEVSNKIFNGKVTVELFQKEEETLAVHILKTEANASSSTEAKRIIEAKPLSDTNGLYAYDDFNERKTYFYTGNYSLNNNVYFAGYYWKITRINTNGSIRLIFNGKTLDPTNGNNTAGNSVASIVVDGEYNHKYNLLASDQVYVGYMIQDDLETTEIKNEKDSNIKYVIDKWYKADILEKNDTKGNSYDTYIEKDVMFCNDRTIKGINYGFLRPQGIVYFTSYNRKQKYIFGYFSCEENDMFTVEKNTYGNKKLKYPVATITLDEAMLASLNVDATGANIYEDNYLVTSEKYWTITPSSTYGSVWAIYGKNFSLGFDVLNDVTNIIGVRPVLSLKADTMFTSGDGSNANPYIIAER